LLKNKSKYKVSQSKGHQGIPDNSSDAEQGEYNEYFIYYKHTGLPEGVFMQETYNTDSYGYEEKLVDVSFVKGKEKKVTVFKPI
jgi:hypothetical protein